MLKPDYSILFVDDDIRYSKAWIERAFDDYNIELVHYEDWESAYTNLKANPEKYHAIILDAKGKLTRDDSSEDMSHIITALQELRELEGHGVIIPYVINTGYYDDSVIKVIRGVKIFSKGSENEMFAYLIDRIKCLPEDRIRKRNEDIFSLFKAEYLPPELDRELLNLLVFAENPSWKKVPENMFNPIRKIMESIFWKLKGMNKIDDKCFIGGKINLKACIDYLNGTTVEIDRVRFTGVKVTPVHINSSMLYIYYLTGTFSHAYLEKTEVSPYALQSVVMAICEVLHWYKCFVIVEKKKI